MALVPCPECTHSVSDLAPACPQCGRPLQAQTPQTGTSALLKSALVWSILLAVVILVLNLIQRHPSAS